MTCYAGPFGYGVWTIGMLGKKSWKNIFWVESVCVDIYVREYQIKLDAPLGCYAHST
ncbi:hypothetical protein ACFL1Z_01260 [Thermodesulfobacteriota bacterium]